MLRERRRVQNRPQSYDAAERRMPVSMTATATEENEFFAMTKTEDEWRAALTPQQFAVLRKQSTERPFSNPLTNEKRNGTFVCAGCGQPLFESAAKFDSGTGWPSFVQPLEGAVGTREDRSWTLATRTEVHCNRCGGHLGHVFVDGPPPTGLRYCMNGVAMKFEPAK